MKRLTLALLLLIASGAFADAIDKRLEQIAAGSETTTGVMAIHIESGRRLSLNAGEAFPMASVYKLPIAIVTLRNVDAGRLTLDQRVTVEPGQYHSGHSPLRDEAGGKRAQFTVRRLVESMVSASDNTACDLLIGLNGGAAEVTRELNLPGIRVDRTEVELQQDVDRAGTKGFLADPRDTATPAAVADLLVRLHTRRLGLSDSSHELLLSAMKGTSTGPNRIRKGVPDGAVVANKTGTWRAGANDAGIIAAPDGKHHVALVVFTKGGNVTNASREAVIAAMTREIYRELLGQRR